MRLYITAFVVVEYQTRMFAAVVEMLTWFAGSQIRNVAVSYYMVVYKTHTSLNLLFSGI